MLRVQVLIPFHRRETDSDQRPGDVIEVSVEELARIRGVNVNMVLVIGEAEEAEPEPEAIPETEPEKPKKKTKKQ